MIRNLRLISLLLIAVGLTLISCSSKNYPYTTGEKAPVPIDNQLSKYNFKIDFGKKHFSGILAVRKMENDEIRILASAPFGMSFFDFGLYKDSIHVYSCIEPMRKKNVLKILENDFSLLFIPDKGIKKTEIKEDCIKFVTGSFLSRTVITLCPLPDTRYIKIKHPWIRLMLQLEKLDENNVE
jgi:hypothetical protein